MMGKAGQSTRKMAADRHSKSVRYALVAVGIAIALFLVAISWQALGISALGFLAAIVGLKVLADIFMSRSDRYSKMERRALRGARGEETVGRILEHLGPDFYPLHDIDSQFGNIDHIVLSRFNGVFLIETKAHGGKVQVLDDHRLLINGRLPEKDFIKQSLSNTYWLKERLTTHFDLEVWITPAVVFTNAFVSRSKPIKGVVVINKKYLPDLLRQGRSNQASREIWNRREDVARVLGIRLSTPARDVPVPPPVITTSPPSKKSHPTQKPKRPLGLQPRQLTIVIGFFLFDLLIIGAGLALVLQ